MEALWTTISYYRACKPRHPSCDADLRLLARWRPAFGKRHQCHLTVVMSGCALQAGRIEEGARLLQDARLLAQDSELPEASFDDIAHGKICLHLQSNHPLKALNALTTQRVAYPYRRVQYHLWRTDALLQAGERGTAETELQAAYALMERFAFAGMQGWADQLARRL